MYRDDINSLIGKTITELGINEEKTLLRITTEAGIIYLITDADCCSETWIEHVSVPELPAKILAVEEKDLGEAPGTRQEYDEKYSTILKTDKGDFEIEYRNSSNGYYGGSLQILETESRETYLPLKDF